MTQSLEQLVDSIIASAKYRNLNRKLIENVGLQELARRRNLKEAVKATKNKLHQAAAAYQQTRPRYEQWLEELRKADDPAALRDCCAEIMQHHASTRERLPILDDFYCTLLADLPPIHSVLDLACGLNPLTLPWMLATGALTADARFAAVDVYEDHAAFLREFFDICRVNGRAWSGDILQDCPAEPVDLGLLLKAVPCLEQLDKRAGPRLLDQIQARVLLVSFPAQSLGGRRKGMVDHYTEHFQSLVEGRRWRVESVLFETELVFRVTKGNAIAANE